MSLSRRSALKLGAGAVALAGASGLPTRRARAQTPPIRIGVLNDQSGLYADLAGVGSVLAARMAVEDFGAAAKGMRVEIVGADHQNRPDVGSTIARQWYDRDGIDCIVDLPTSSVALAVSEITQQKDRVAIVSTGASTDLTGSKCNANTIHWTYDTYCLGYGTGRAMVAAGGDTWFFITADYAFGHALERDTSAFVRAGGGRVLGAVRHPFPGTDFSSFLLQAQASRAKVIGLANAGGDTTNCIKQAAEFGITRGGQKLAGLLVFITDVHSLGLQTAQGLVLTETFYWDQNDASRAFTNRFHPQNRGVRPSMGHAGVYSGVLHYLKAVEAMGVANAKASGKAVVERMKAMPTNDPLFGAGSVRQDGRKIHPAYLFEVKAPGESRGPWDYYKTVRTIPAAEAWRPLADGGCALVR